MTDEGTHRDGGDFAMRIDATERALLAALPPLNGRCGWNIGASTGRWDGPVAGANCLRIPEATFRRLGAVRQLAVHAPTRKAGPLTPTPGLDGVVLGWTELGPDDPPRSVRLCWWLRREEVAEGRVWGCEAVPVAEALGTRGTTAPPPMLPAAEHGAASGPEQLLLELDGARRRLRRALASSRMGGESKACRGATSAVRGALRILEDAAPMEVMLLAGNPAGDASAHPAEPLADDPAAEVAEAAAGLERARRAVGAAYARERGTARQAAWFALLDGAAAKLRTATRHLRSRETAEAHLWASWRALNAVLDADGPRGRHLSPEARKLVAYAATRLSFGGFNPSPNLGPPPPVPDLDLAGLEREGLPSPERIRP